MGIGWWRQLPRAQERLVHSEWRVPGSSTRVPRSHWPGPGRPPTRRVGTPTPPMPRSAGSVTGTEPIGRPTWPNQKVEGSIIRYSYYCRCNLPWGPASHTPAVILGLAHAVSDFVNRLEHDLGVNGNGLKVLFCLAVIALILLLLIYNRFSKRRAIRLAHAGKFVAPDPYARGFHLHRDDGAEADPDPVTHGPARDSSNPRYRPEIQLPSVPDPIFPTLGEVRLATLSSAGDASSDLAAVPADSGVSANPELSPNFDPSLGGGTFPTLSSVLAGVSSAQPAGVPHGPVDPGSGVPSAAAPGFFDSAIPRTSAAGAETVRGAAAVDQAPIAGWYEDPEGTPGSLPVLGRDSLDGAPSGLNIRSVTNPMRQLHRARVHRIA